MQEKDYYHQVAELFSRGDLMFAANSVDEKSAWNPGSLARFNLKYLAIMAASKDMYTMAAEEDGRILYTAQVVDYVHGFEDRGTLALVFREGAFDGISLDLSALNKGSYHLYPDGRFVRHTDEGEKELGPIRTHLMQNRIMRLQPLHLRRQR